MDLAHPASLLMPAGIAALVGWRLWRRIRRMLGRQRLSRVRPWLAVGLLPLLLLVLALGCLQRPLAAAALAGGVVAGTLLGGLGLRRTRFEVTPEGLFYTPDTYLGMALSLLLVLRLAWRAAQLQLLQAGREEVAVAALQASPLTLLVLGTLLAYHVRYAAGLLCWRRQVELAGGP